MQPQPIVEALTTPEPQGQANITNGSMQSDSQRLLTQSLEEIRSGVLKPWSEALRASQALPWASDPEMRRRFARMIGVHHPNPDLSLDPVGHNRFPLSVSEAALLTHVDRVTNFNPAISPYPGRLSAC